MLPLHHRIAQLFDSLPPAIPVVQGRPKPTNAMKITEPKCSDLVPAEIDIGTRKAQTDGLIVKNIDTTRTIHNI